MKTYKCEEMMCNGCVTRIDKALTGADTVSYTHLDVYKRQSIEKA